MTNAQRGSGKGLMFDLIQESLFRKKRYFGNGQAMIIYSYEESRGEQAALCSCRINELRLILARTLKHNQHIFALRRSSCYGRKLSDISGYSDCTASSKRKMVTWQCLRYIVVLPPKRNLDRITLFMNLVVNVMFVWVRHTSKYIPGFPRGIAFIVQQ